VVPSEKYAEMFSWLDRLRSFCEARRIALIVSVIPDGKQVVDPATTSFQRHVRRWCSHAGVPFLNPVTELAAHDGRWNYFPWDSHLNEKGHGNYATFLFAATRPTLERVFGRTARAAPGAPARQ